MCKLRGGRRRGRETVRGAGVAASGWVMEVGQIIFSRKKSAKGLKKWEYWVVSKLIAKTIKY